MEGKKREPTIEILRRLQSQNKKKFGFRDDAPIKFRAEDILGLEEEKVSKIRPAKGYSEGVILLNNIKEIESRLKRGRNYFDHYYDLRKNEDKLLKFYNSFENREGLPDEIKLKVKEIEKKFKKV
jgi:hypothetical protein